MPPSGTRPLGKHRSREHERTGWRHPDGWLRLSKTRRFGACSIAGYVEAGGTIEHRDVLSMSRRIARLGYAIALFAAQMLGAKVTAAIHLSSDCPLRDLRRAEAVEAKCYSMEYASMERTFRLYVPQKRAQPLPLVLVLHGGGGDGAAMEKLTRHGFNRIADRDGAVIAYPDGFGRGWNDGRMDQTAKPVAEQVDDLGFLRALPAAISAQIPIDPKRVYATGISNGGLMSYRLACDSADVFAAVAPVAANLSVELASRCRPSRPISIAIINGTDDPIMPWNGGAIRLFWRTHGTVLSTQATVDRWIALDRCGSRREVGNTVDSNPAEGTSVYQHFAQCAERTEVRLYEIRGGGHTWPGGWPYLGAWIVGKLSQKLDANGVIWDFFRQHPL